MPKLMSRPKCVLRVDGTAVECLEQPGPSNGLGLGYGLNSRAPHAPTKPKSHRTPALYLALEKQLAWNRRRDHSAAWLPPRFATDMIPHVRTLKHWWNRMGLSF
jgi:hypothetical protein